MGAGVAVCAVLFQLPVRARVADWAGAFHPAVRAGVAVHAIVFHLPVRAGSAVRADGFHLPVRAGSARRTLVFQLAVRTRAALRAHIFQLAVRAGVAVRAPDFQLAVRAGGARRAPVFQVAKRTRATRLAPIFPPSVMASLRSHFRAPRHPAHTLLRADVTSRRCLVTFSLMFRIERGNIQVIISFHCGQSDISASSVFETDYTVDHNFRSGDIGFHRSLLLPLRRQTSTLPTRARKLESHLLRTAF